MEHRFDSIVAEKYGLAEAILLNNIAFWVEKNRADGRHFFNGRYWTYNSVKGYRETFPYLSTKQIRSALEHLRRERIIETGNFGTDRTLWYTIAPQGKSNCPTGQMEMPHRANEIAPQGKSSLYTDNKNTDSINTDIDPRACACEEKTEYAPNVFLTEAEHKALCEKYGEKLCGELTELLSEKKRETGKYGKRDFRSLSGWVYEAWRERNEREQKGTGLSDFDLFDFAERPPAQYGDADESEESEESEEKR